MNRLDDELYDLSRITWIGDEVQIATRRWQEWFPRKVGDGGSLDQVCIHVHYSIDRMRTAGTRELRDMAVMGLLALIDSVKGLVPMIPGEVAA